MLKREVIFTPEAKSDLDNVESFVSGIHQKEAGKAFVNRIVMEVLSLSYSAGIFQSSCFQTARAIHPEAKTLPIMKRHWTVVFHIDGNYVIVDRILPSSTMA